MVSFLQIYFTVILLREHIIDSFLEAIVAAAKATRTVRAAGGMNHSSGFYRGLRLLNIIIMLPELKSQ